jgi:hypothetical protein
MELSELVPQEKSLSEATFGSWDEASDDGKSLRQNLNIEPGLLLNARWLDTINGCAEATGVDLVAIKVAFDPPFKGCTSIRIAIDVADCDDKVFVDFCEALGT